MLLLRDRVIFLSLQDRHNGPICQTSVIRQIIPRCDFSFMYAILTGVVMSIATVWKLTFADLADKCCVHDFSRLMIFQTGSTSRFLRSMIPVQTSQAASCV